MKYSEKLKDKYYNSFKSLVPAQLDWYVQEADFGEFYESHLLGSVFWLTPSGKVYTCWTTNQTARDVIRDGAWWEAFDRWLDEHGLWSESEGEDVFICRSVQEWVEWRNEEGELWNDTVYPKAYLPPDVPVGYEPEACGGE